MKKNHFGIPEHSQIEINSWLSWIKSILNVQMRRSKANIISVRSDKISNYLK